MGMYESAQKREPPTKAVSLKNAQPEPGAVGKVPQEDEGFASAMKEHHEHQADYHRTRAEHHEKESALHAKAAAYHRGEVDYHESKAGDY